MSWVSRPEELNSSQNRLEEMFIRRLVTHLPDTVHPLILADRGFGRASLPLLTQRLPSASGYPVECVIRLRDDVIAQSDAFRGRLRDYPLRKNRILFVRGVKYRQDGAVTTNLALFWGRGHAQAWYLATSLSDPKLAVKMYRRRMQPEQYFRDGKQRFALDSTTVTTSSRLQRLLVGVLIACVALILVGTRVSPYFRRRVCSWGSWVFCVWDSNAILRCQNHHSCISACLTLKLGMREIVFEVDIYFYRSQSPSASERF